MTEQRTLLKLVLPDGRTRNVLNSYKKDAKMLETESSLTVVHGLKTGISVEV